MSNGLQLYLMLQWNFSKVYHCTSGIRNAIQGSSILLVGIVMGTQSTVKLLSLAAHTVS